MERNLLIQKDTKKKETLIKKVYCKRFKKTFNAARRDEQNFV